MLEEFKKGTTYGKIFSFKIGTQETKSIKIILENKYNVSAILRKTLNDVANDIEIENILKD